MMSYELGLVRLATRIGWTGASSARAASTVRPRLHGGCLRWLSTSSDDDSKKTWREAHMDRAGSDGGLSPPSNASVQKLDDVVNRLMQNDPLVFQHRLPAPWWRRICSGAIDLAIAGAVASAVAFPPLLMDMISADDSATVLLVAGTAVWSLRDCVTPEGNRSIGKKLLGIELALWDGDLPSRTAAFIRNMYWWLFPAALYYPIMEDFAFLALAFDASALLLTSDRRKVGDWAIGTTVILEQDDRGHREELAAVADEIQELEKIVDKLSKDMQKKIDKTK